MGFALNNNFPVLEMAFSNRPIAWIITRNRELIPVKIKAINDEFFICKYGWYRLKSGRPLNYKKQKILLFSSYNMNPLEPRALKEIEKFLKVTDRVALEKWLDEEDEKLAQQISEEAQKQNEITFIFKKDAQGNVVTGEDGKPVLIEKEKLKQIARVSREPIDPQTELWLAEYGSIDPALLMTGTELLHQTKKIKDMLSHPITTKIPIILVIVGIIGFLVFMQQGPAWLAQFNSMLHPGASAAHFLLSLLGK